MSDRTHLEGRHGITPEDIPPGTEVDRWSGKRVPAHVRVLREAWAGEYVRLLAAGDAGGAFAYLRALQRDQPDADPWHLTELVAAKILARKDR